MARYMVERNFVQVVGRIWMPAIVAATEYPLSAYDVKNIGELTRENVSAWLDTHAGDFQAVQDFRASVGDTEIDWESEENECVYNDCMFPAE